MTENEIKALIFELNRIEVKGEENLDVLLGCIKFLRIKLKDFQKPMMEVKVKEFLDPVAGEATANKAKAEGCANG